MDNLAHILAVSFNGYYVPNNYYHDQYEIEEKNKLIYLKGVKEGDVKCMYELSQFYKNRGDENSMIEYLEMASKCKHLESIIGLAHHFKNYKKYKIAEKYFIMGIELGYHDSYYQLGCIYRITKRFSEMEHMFNLAFVICGNTDGLCELAEYYKEKKNYVDMEKYLHMAIEQKNGYACYLLGKYYEKIRDITNMIKYWNMGMVFNNVHCLIDLGKYYYKNKEYDNALKCYLKKASESKEKIFVKEINECLRKNMDINIIVACRRFLDKKNLQKLVATNKLKKIECCICYEDVVPALYNCNCKMSHICNSCFNKISRCPICRETIK